MTTTLRELLGTIEQLEAIIKELQARIDELEAKRDKVSPGDLMAALKPCVDGGGICEGCEGCDP